MKADGIEGVFYQSLEWNPDLRGSLDVVYCKTWPSMPAVEQWNVVRSKAGVLRGVHAHSRYDEIYIPLLGRMFIVLKDARHHSASFGATVTKWIDNVEAYQAIIVPAGIAHGVFFATDGILTYGLSSPWSGDNEFNCHWKDPEIGVDWPAVAPLLSTRDARAGTYANMVAALNAELVVKL